MNASIRLRALMLGCAALLEAMSAQAALPTPQFDTTTLSSVSFSNGCNQTQSSALGASSACHTTGNFSIGAADSGATASAGRTSAYATVDVATPNANFAAVQGTGSAQAHLNDYIQFSGAANSQAMLNGVIVVHGGLTGGVEGPGISNSSANASYSATGGFFGQSFGQSGTLFTSTDGTSNLNHISGTPVPVSVLLNFDANGLTQVGAFTLSLSVYANGSAHGFPGTNPTTPGAASAGALFGETAYWGGVTSVLDLNGNALLGVTSVSSSGLNYMTSAVPEPTTAMLMGVGMLGLGALRRRHTS